MLAWSQCAFGRSCDRPSRHTFSWFSSVKKMLIWFPRSKLLLQPSRVELIKIKTLCWKYHDIVCRKLCNSVLILKLPLPLYQSTASIHPNFFTSTLHISEGRVSEAWEPSKKTTLFLPPTVKRLTSLVTFLFTYSSTILPYLCLSLNWLLYTCSIA
jgi:hypothetical protein